MSKWTANNIPKQLGRTAVVTGTGGLGYETALALARAGGKVILAGRNPQKGAAAVARIQSTVPSAIIDFEWLDLADLGSVRDFAGRIKTEMDGLDLLINNAGVMVPPTRQETADGFELQLGTNYLGHFALTAHLLPVLRNGRNPRVVTLASIAARGGAIDFGDPNAENDYKPMPVYSQSKLACLMFALELERRSREEGWGIASIAAHPGVSRTELLLNAPGRLSLERIMRTILPFMFQPAHQGALPILFAATAGDAQGGGYYGPDRLSETRGHPAAARVPPQATDATDAVRLWLISEQMAGVCFCNSPPATGS